MDQCWVQCPSKRRRCYCSFPPDTGILSVGCQSKPAAHFQESEGIDMNSRHSKARTTHTDSRWKPGLLIARYQSC